MSGQLTSYFVIADEQALESFKTDLTDMGLSDDFTVTSDLDTVEQTLEPIENMQSFAKIFLLVVLIVGGGILMILNMINIRERKYEIGVLTAIGMKKGKVAMQFVCELFAVTLVSIIIGTSIGAVASVPVASKLLESQISSQTSSTQQVSENFGKSGSTDMPQGQSGGGRGDNGGGMDTMMSSRSNVKYVDQINAAVNIPVLLELLAIGIFLTLLSGSVALIAISRYSPLKILSSRT
ncbi:hypothetical protein SDC9_147476 [bioreactor metagenome]|uniref:ABC3 transporter permease C-terminal domain-containing protein n=1 Tax=bioreactor metagenome TaxID=1076179 RepID=A0A645EG62_9ZZZZ